MKKKILMVIIFFIIMINIISLATNINNNKQKEIKINFIEKCSFKDLEDGWTYYVCLDYKTGDDSKTINNATFDGVNLKYSTLEDYYITVTDENNNVIDKISADLVSLSTGDKTSSDLLKINTFLESKHFNREITTEDLSIDLDIVDKNIIVELYNDAFNKETLTAGKYMELSFSNALTSSYQDNYKFQIIYILNYGNIGKVNIEVIYEDGTYLSDKVNDNIATKEELEFNNYIKEIENQILKNNTFKLKNMKKKFGNYKLTELNNLLKELEENSN